MVTVNFTDEEVRIVRTALEIMMDKSREDVAAIVKYIIDNKGESYDYVNLYAENDIVNELHTYYKTRLVSDMISRTIQEQMEVIC